MKTSSLKYILAGAISLALTQVVVQAQIITDIGTTSGLNGPTGFKADIGLQYVVGSSAIQINDLGIFVGNGTTGLDNEGVVDLWLPTANSPTATTGTLLTSAIFQAGAGAGQANDSFVYSSLSTPVTLAAGTVFILSRTGDTSWVTNNPLTGLTLDPAVSFSDDGNNPSRIVNGDGTNATFPVGKFPDGTAENYITANAEFTVVPEPSSVVLSLISVATMLAFIRFRRTQA